jgi:hypothetical protein
MTPEQTWSKSTNPETLLRAVEGRVSDRQLRLFACACARVYFDQLSEQGKKTLEVAERFVDDPTLFDDMIRAGMQSAAGYQLFRERRPDEGWEELIPQLPSTSPLDQLARSAAYGSASKAATAAATVSIRGYSSRSRAPQTLALLKEVFGNPFSPSVIDPMWLLGSDRTIEKMARVIDKERAFERMPILGDALEEAGCHDAAILEHCRADTSECRHVRGCWVLELLFAAAGRDKTRRGGLAELHLPGNAWLVTCKTRGRKSPFPFDEKVRPHILPLLAQDDPLYIVSKECSEELLSQSPDVRSVADAWFLEESSGIALKENAKGKVQQGPNGRVWLYTKRDKAISDLAEVYEPVKVLLELVKGPPSCRDLARKALEGDWQAPPLIARLLAKAGDSRAQTFQAFAPPSEPEAAAKSRSPEEELADLQMRATPCPRCGKPRRALRVKKEGPNQGRLFLACSDRACDSFEWASSPAGKAPAGRDDSLELIQRGLRGLYEECFRCGATPVLGRATKAGPNQGRFFLRCSECEKFDWLTDGDGDFMDPDIE